MQYQAIAKYIRMGPRKVRLIADSIRGMNAMKSVSFLMMTPRLAAKPMIIVIQSAMSNAKNKQAVVGELKIASIDVMGGPVLKRWHAASKGMAHPYKKRMSHVKVVLTDNKKENLPAQAGT